MLLSIKCWYSLTWICKLSTIDSLKVQTAMHIYVTQSVFGTLMGPTQQTTGRNLQGLARIWLRPTDWSFLSFWFTLGKELLNVSSEKATAVKSADFGCPGCKNLLLLFLQLWADRLSCRHSWVWQFIKLFMTSVQVSFSRLDSCVINKLLIYWFSVVRTLLALHRTATLRHDELGQVI